MKIGKTKKLIRIIFYYFLVLLSLLKVYTIVLSPPLITLKIETLKSLPHAAPRSVFVPLYSLQGILANLQ